MSITGSVIVFANPVQPQLCQCIREPCPSPALSLYWRTLFSPFAMFMVFANPVHAFAMSTFLANTVHPFDLSMFWRTLSGVYPFALSMFWRTLSTLLLCQCFGEPCLPFCSVHMFWRTLSTLLLCPRVLASTAYPFALLCFGEPCPSPALSLYWRTLFSPFVMFMFWRTLSPF